MPERRAWSVQEDNILKYLREEMQLTKWSVIAKKMSQEYSIPDRTGKQCRERYHNHLDSTILRTQWSVEQEQYLYQLHDEIGNKWAIIAQKLPGRTDNCVKNHFYSKMRKSIRKLNKIIYQYFKKEIKEIKMTVLYKIIQATDEKFKTNPNVQQSISSKCCNLKKMLLLYSNDDNTLQNDTQKLGELAREIHDFSSRYRRKPKKTRRPSVQGSDLLKLPRFEHKVKSSSDVEDEDSEFSMVLSHDCGDDSDEQYEIKDGGSRSKLQAIKQVDDLKESTNSKLDKSVQMENQTISVEVKPALMRPPAIMKPPVMNGAQMCVESGDKVEQFLKNQGILENSLQFSGNLKQSGQLNLSRHVGIRAPQLKGDLTQSIDQESINGNNFLSESIERMRISDVNFDVELDQENKLFISN